MDSLSALVGAVALFLASWIAPMMWPKIPHWIQVALLWLAVAMLLLAVVLPFLKRKEQKAGDTFNQDHSGDGDNIMDIRR